MHKASTRLSFHSLTRTSFGNYSTRLSCTEHSLSSWWHLSTATSSEGSGVSQVGSLPLSHVAGIWCHSWIHPLLTPCPITCLRLRSFCFLSLFLPSYEKRLFWWRSPAPFQSLSALWCMCCSAHELLPSQKCRFAGGAWRCPGSSAALTKAEETASSYSRRSAVSWTRLSREALYVCVFCNKTKKTVSKFFLVKLQLALSLNSFPRIITAGILSCVVAPSSAQLDIPSW